MNIASISGIEMLEKGASLWTASPPASSPTILNTSEMTAVPPHNSTIASMEDERVREYIQQLQDEEFKGYVPALIFLVLIAVTGCIGNVLVLIVYKTKYHRTSTRVFIIAIACFDLVANIVCIPGEIHDFYYLWDFPSVYLCKLVRFANASSTILSGFTLLALAVARYRKVCRPFKWQVTTKQTKYISVGISIFGLVASVPFAIIKGIHTRATPISGIYGRECADSDDYYDTIWPMVNNAFFLLVFISLCVPLVVLYCLIGVKAYQHSKLHGVPVLAKQSDVTTPTQSFTSTEDVLEETPTQSPKWWQRSKKRPATDSSALSSECTLDRDTESRQESSEASYHGNKVASDERKGYEVTMFHSPSCENVAINVSMVDKMNRNPHQDKALANSYGLDCLETGRILIPENKNEIGSSTKLRAETEDTESKESMSGQEASELCQTNKNDPKQGHRVEPSISYLKPPTKNKSLSRKVSWETNFLETKPKTRNCNKADREPIKFPENVENEYNNDKSTCSKTSKNHSTPTATRQNETQRKDSKRNASTTNQTTSKSSVRRKSSQFEKVFSRVVKNTNRHRNRTSRGVINRTTGMLFLITFVYIVGYLPYLVLVFFRFLAADRYEAMGLTETAFFNVFLRFFFINSAANSVVYSLCDPLFRKEVYKLLRGSKCKSRDHNSKH